MIIIINQHASAVGNNWRHPRVGPKLREPVPRTEPAHGPVNIAVAELGGIIALGAPRCGLCFSGADGSHGAALRRRARSKRVRNWCQASQSEGSLAGTRSHTI